MKDHSWKRHLPHFQICNSYYFITFTTHNRRILSDHHKDFIFDAINFLDGNKYELHAAVVLNDHAHIIIVPSCTISEIMHSIKSYTAHQINKTENRRGKVWQDENYDRVLRSEEEYMEKLNYVANNPIKAGLSVEYGDYKWLYIKGWSENS